MRYLDGTITSRSTLQPPPHSIISDPSERGYPRNAGQRPQPLATEYKNTGALVKRWDLPAPSRESSGLQDRLGTG